MADADMHYDAAANAALGKATGALLEFLGLKQDCLEKAGVLRLSCTSAFIHDYGYRPTREQIGRIPEALAEAFRRQSGGDDPPPIAHCRDVGEMLEKGARLAALAKDDLRAGTAWMMRERGIDIAQLAEASGVPASTIRSFVKNDRNGRNLSTHTIARLADALDLDDIFALEAAGRDAPGRTADPPGARSAGRGR